MKLRRLPVLGTAVLLAICIAPLYAQASTGGGVAAESQVGTPPPTSGASSSEHDSLSLEEVLITAQRRSESKQTVPLTVDSFDTKQLAIAAAVSTEDLPTLVPGLTLQRAGTGTAIFMRGLGNVLTYSDGVLELFGVSNDVFNNAASVEIDKGPQGTLFGRNATGGVVQYNTKAPSPDPSADLTVGYGNYNNFTTSVYGTTALSGNIATSLDATFNDQVNGWGRNLYNGHDTYQNKNYAFRSKTVWNVSEDTTLTLGLNYQSTRESQGNAAAPAKFIPFTYDLVTGSKFYVPGYFNVNQNVDPYYTDQMGIVSVRLEHNFGGFQGLSISSFQRDRQYLSIDYDGTPTPFFNLLRRDELSGWTQEFQLQSKDDSKVKWVLGAFYLTTSAFLDAFSFQGIGAQVAFGAPAGVAAYNIVASTPSHSVAGFGQATIPLIYDTSLTLGARYTEDHVSILGYNAYDTTPIAGSGGGSHNAYGKPSYRVGFEHNFMPDLLSYVSFSHGYNAGGFNNVLTSGFNPWNHSNDVQPEYIDAWEVGVKSEWFDHRLRVNASGFLYKYTNLQLPFYASGGIGTVNAASSRITGFDLDGEARLGAHLHVTGGVEFLHSIFSEYEDAPLYSIAPNGALITTQGSATGNYTPSAPKLGANLALVYVEPTPVGDFTSSARVSYSAKWYADVSNQFGEPAHSLVDLTETWSAPDNLTTVSLWVKNLSDVRYDAGINLLAPVGVLAEAGAPRMFGFTVKRHF